MEEPGPQAVGVGVPLCEHDRTEVRRKTTCGGSLMYGRQCLRCGRVVGSWLRKDVALRLGLPRPWDDALAQRWDEEARLAWQRKRQGDLEARLAADLAFRREYEDYLRSPEWQAKRALVLQRCGGVCEGCRKRKAVEVHHLTYVRFKREMLFDLAGVCRECHEVIHGQRAG